MDGVCVRERSMRHGCMRASAYSCVVGKMHSCDPSCLIISCPYSLLIRDLIVHRFEDVWLRCMLSIQVHSSYPITTLPALSSLPALSASLPTNCCPMCSDSFSFCFSFSALSFPMAVSTNEPSSFAAFAVSTTGRCELYILYINPYLCRDSTTATEVPHSMQKTGRGSLLKTLAVCTAGTPVCLENKHKQSAAATANTWCEI